MLLLLGAALFAFGFLLFSLGVAVWLIGLTLRIAIRLFQFALLLVWAGVVIYRWLRRQQKVEVLEGEILLPERQALPRSTKLLPLLLVGVMVLMVSPAAASKSDRQQCPL